MLFVVVLWILGFVLSVAFITDGVVYLSGLHRVQRRMARLGLDREVYRILGVIEIVGGFGLLLSALSAHPGTWPGLFTSSGMVWIGLPSAILLITLKLFLVRYHRSNRDDPNDYLSALVLALLGVAYLIAFGARQVVHG